jgi:prophage maintenance system killer protein
VDGNKRTAWAATAVFYQINGYIIFAEDGQIVGLVVDAKPASSRPGTTFVHQE